MDLLVYIAAAIVVAVLLWFVTRSGPKPENPPLDEGSQPQLARESGVRRRRNIRSGIQQRVQDARAQDDSEPEEEDKTSGKDGKIGAKKMKKLQEKEERKRVREQETRDREERKKDRAEQDEKRKLEEESKLKEEARVAEENKKEQEEKERKEHEEYLKLKAMFSVEEEGHQELDSDEQGQNMLMEFVEYVKANKVVLLEDLASHFGLRTQDAIERVQNMLNDEILTGVIDDRGKFIYISNEELQAVAKFVKQRGRVSIGNLAQASNSLINLVSESVTAKS